MTTHWSINQTSIGFLWMHLFRTKRSLKKKARDRMQIRRREERGRKQTWITTKISILKREQGLQEWAICRKEAWGIRRKRISWSWIILDSTSHLSKLITLDTRWWLVWTTMTTMLNTIMKRLFLQLKWAKLPRISKIMKKVQSISLK